MQWKTTHSIWNLSSYNCLCLTQGGSRVSYRVKKRSVTRNYPHTCCRNTFTHLGYFLASLSACVVASSHPLVISSCFSCVCIWVWDFKAKSWWLRTYFEHAGTGNVGSVSSLCRWLCSFLSWLCPVFLVLQICLYCFFVNRALGFYVVTSLCDLYQTQEGCSLMC